MNNYLIYFTFSFLSTEKNVNTPQKIEFKKTHKNICEASSFYSASKISIIFFSE